MEQIHITCRMAASKMFPKGSHYADVAGAYRRGWQKSRARARVAAPEMAKGMVDLLRHGRDVKLESPQKRSDSLFVFRHSAAHLLRGRRGLWNSSKRKDRIGPPIDTGFLGLPARRSRLHRKTWPKSKKKKNARARRRRTANERTSFPSPRSRPVQKSNQIFKCEHGEEKATTDGLLLHHGRETSSILRGPRTIPFHQAASRRSRAVNVAAPTGSAEGRQSPATSALRSRILTQKELGPRISTHGGSQGLRYRKIGTVRTSSRHQRKKPAPADFLASKGGFWIRKSRETGSAKSSLARVRPRLHPAHHAPRH